MRLLDDDAIRPPARPYRIDAEPGGDAAPLALEVDPARIPYSRRGLPGSLLDRLLAPDGPPIRHVCGGLGACGTCAVELLAGADSCRPPDAEETRVLLETPPPAEGTPGATRRLACRCVPDGSAPVRIRIG